MSNREQVQPLHADERRQRGLSPWRITAMLSATLVAASAIGMAISAGFCIAIVVMLVGAFHT